MRLIQISKLACFALLCVVSCAPNVIDSGRMAGDLALPAEVKAVHVTLEKGSISVRRSADSTIRWEAATRKGATDPADLEVLRPIEMKLEAKSDGVILRLEGPRVPAELASRDKGAALVMKLALEIPDSVDLVLRTDRGPVGVAGWSRQVDLHTGAGDIVLDSCTGESKTFTGSGNHTVTGARGGLDLTSEHGDFIVYTDEISPTGITVSARSGSVQCGVPPGCSFELEAETSLGEIETAFDVKREKAGKRGARATGSVGGGGPKVKLIAKRGSVSIREHQREQ